VPPCPVTDTALTVESVGPSGTPIKLTHPIRQRLAGGGLIGGSLLTTALVSCDKVGQGRKQEQESRKP